MAGSLYWTPDGGYEILLEYISDLANRSEPGVQVLSYLILSTAFH